MTAFLQHTMIRLGLCCTFRDQPIKFANTTATAARRRYFGTPSTLAWRGDSAIKDRAGGAGTYAVACRPLKGNVLILIARAAIASRICHVFVGVSAVLAAPTTSPACVVT